MAEEIPFEEAKDRLDDVKSKNNPEVVSMIETLIEQNPFDGFPFYIFTHKRTIEMDERWRMWVDRQGMVDFDELPTHRLLWQARLTKPQAQENSMLFKVNPQKPEEVKVIWILPEQEKFDLYKAGKFFADQITTESIHDYLYDKTRLEAPEEGDLDDETIRTIYVSKGMKTRFFKPFS